MGCWNKTCGISNLHINAGDQVYVFVLEENPYHDRCYSTAFWRPVMLPFMTVYDDYGGGENSHKNIEYILAGLREQLVEMPLGDNEYHDIVEVTAAKLDDKLFFEAVHEGRLKVGDRFGGTESLVDFVMMRADIVDNICENWVREQYVGDGKGTGGWGNNYNFYKFEDLVAGVPEFMDKLMSELNGTSENADDVLPPTLRLKYAMRGLRGLYSYEDHNLVAEYLGSVDDYRFSRIVRPSDAVVTLAVEGKREEAEALLVDILRASFINSFMENCRKMWMPGGHEGSQSAEHSPYRVLCGAVNAVLDAEVAQRAEWEEDK